MVRYLLSFLLAAVLAVSSVTFAVGQHNAAPVTTVVICSDNGDQTLIIDAQGKPVPFGHACPDCVAAMAAQDLPAALPMPMPPLTMHVQKPREYVAVALTRAATPSHARGPPLLM